MTTITLYIDGATEARLRQAAEDLGRRIEDLAEAAISEAALDFFRYQPSRDPGRIDAAAHSAATRRMEAAL